jgi:uncharacterized membrane protein YcaP (DUF421 family)
MFTILHALFGYVYLLLTVRVLNRRPGAQMTLFEFVLVFLIGGVIILSVVGDDRSETNSVCAVIAVGMMHRLMSALAVRYPKFAEIVYGIPLVLLENGQWHTDIMRRASLQEMDVMAAARTKGVRTFDEIRYAILERNGGISIIQK